MSVIEIGKSNFEQEVTGSEELVLLDFFATWCMPCKMLSPIIHEISKECRQVKVCRIDVETEPELASAFQIMSIPTLILVKNGTIVGQLEGFQNKKSIKKMLEYWK